MCRWDACSVEAVCLWKVAAASGAMGVCMLLLTCWHEWRREAECWFQSLHFSRSHNPLQIQDPSENRAICRAETFFFFYKGVVITCVTV